MNETIECPAMNRINRATIRSRLGTRRPGLASALGLMSAAIALVALSSCGWSGDASDADHVASVKSWRTERAADLRGEESWLTLVALHFLDPGETRFGSAPDNGLVLPATAPPHAGTLLLENGRVSLVAAEGVDLSIGGRAVTRATLRSTEDEGGPDVVNLGRIRFYVIERAGRIAIRAKDPDSPVRTEFKGLDYFPVQRRFRVTGRMEPHDVPREIAIPTALGTEETGTSPGIVRFEIDGTPLALEPLESGSKLFFIFRDLTAEDATYGAGRFLYTEKPGADGLVELDFNRAYNPPCAFTEFATCPLPPRQNVLDIRIEAGEKRFGDH